MRGRRERVLVAVCLLGALAWPALAPAKGSSGRSVGGSPPDQADFFQGLSLGSSKDPITINADALELDYKGSVLTYSGNVKVTQGDVTLTSDKLAITYDRQAVQRSRAPQVAGSESSATAPSPAAAPSPQAANGARSSANLGSDADKIKEVVAEGNVRIQRGDRVAEGRRAVFDQAKQTIVLSDHAVLHEGANQVAGERIIVYLQEQRSVVEGGSNSRVSAVFYPNATNASAAPPVTATAASEGGR